MSDLLNTPSVTEETTFSSGIVSCKRAFNYYGSAFFLGGGPSQNGDMLTLGREGSGKLKLLTCFGTGRKIINDSAVCTRLLKLQFT